MEHPRSVLLRHGIEAKKSLGQNFIHDDRILARIVDAASISQRDQVLEIGAGLGALTWHLAELAGRVVALEIDNRLIPVLEQQLGSRANIEIVQDDVLNCDPAVYFPGAYKVVGNVPYYITGAILRHFLDIENKPELMVVTVQLEVAQRIMAQPGDMSMLSVMVQYYAKPRLLFNIAAGAFWPRPEVDSAVVHIETKVEQALPPEQEDAFFRLMRVGFSQKRKQLQKNLRALGQPKERLEDAFLEAGVEGRRRAQSLSVGDWIALHRALL